jgi:hypothetical protein
VNNVTWISQPVYSIKHGLAIHGIKLDKRVRIRSHANKVAVVRVLKEARVAGQQELAACWSGLDLDVSV